MNPTAVAALLLLLVPPRPAQEPQTVPIKVLVVNSLNSAQESYSVHMADGGILLGALKRLKSESNGKFHFTVTEHEDFGFYLESVNGLAGSPSDQTFWELRVRKPLGTNQLLDVGVGCYIPSRDDQIILTFKRW